MKPETLFCIHGNSSSSKVFQSLTNYAECPYTIVAPDLPGHGKNQGQFEMADFSMAGLRRFLLEQLAKIDGDILLIGNSLGGHLAIEIAPQVKNLKGLIIMGTPPVKKPINFEDTWIDMPALATFLNEAPTKNEILEAATTTVSKKTNSAFVIEGFNIANPLVRKSLAYDVSNNKLENEFEIFTNLEIPKYIIAGDTDLSVNKNYLQLVKDNSKNHCEIIEFKDCGHYPPLDSPKLFNEVVTNIAKNIFGP